jgi:hypothetical protein
MASTTTTAAAQAVLGQPTFASQLRYPAILPLGVAPQGQKGYMIWDQPGTSGNNDSGLNYTGGVGNTGRAMIDFLFNPSEISFSASVGDTTAQVLQSRKYAGSTVVDALPQNQSASWTIYYDRTYEVWNGTASGATNDPAVIGVQADVLQFYQFTGMLSTASDTTALAASIPTGMMVAPMVMVYSWVYFGTNANGTTASGGSNTNALQSQLAYYGYISSFSVEYTRFSGNMVPTQCEVDVSFTVVSPTVTNGTNTAFGTVLNSNGSGTIGNYGT